MSDFIQGFQRMVPVGSRVELWAHGDNYRVSASVVHGTTQQFFDHQDLDRPAPPPEPPANPAPIDFLPDSGQLYSVLFLTKFEGAAVSAATLTLRVMTIAGAVHEAPLVFSISGKKSDPVDRRIVAFNTRKP